MKKVFSFWRIVLSVAWSKSLLWSVTAEKETRTMLLAVNIIKRDKRNALEIAIGPLLVVVGLII